MASKMEYNQALKDVYDNIKTIDSGSFTSFVSESQAAFTTLKTGLTNALDSLNIGDTWDDDVKVEINSTTYTGLDSIINSCEAAINNSVVPAAAKVNALIQTLKSYIESVDSYNAALEERDKIDVGTEPQSENYIDETSYNNAHSAWSARKNNYDAYTQLMTNQESNASKYETMCNTKINEIKGLFGDAEAAASAAANAESGGGLTPKTRTRENPDGSVTTITEWYDETGKKVEETYQTVTKDGKVVEVGRTEFDGDQRTTKNYTTTTEEFTQDVTYVYGPDGKIINSQYDTVYANGDFSSTSASYWETTGHMKTFDYIYDSTEGWKLQAHNEYNEQGIQTVGNSVYETEDELASTVGTYDEQGRRIQYVRNSFDPETNELQVSGLVTNHYEGDNRYESGYTYDSRYPDGKRTVSEYTWVRDDQGHITELRTDSHVSFELDGSGRKTVYEYSDTGVKTGETTEMFDSSGQRTGTKVRVECYTETGEYNGYTYKEYDITGALVREGDHRYNTGEE